MSPFWNCGTPNISETVESRNFKFGTEMEGRSTKKKKSKFGQRGHVGSRDPLLKLFGPPNISGPVEAGNSKIGKKNCWQ